MSKPGLAVLVQLTATIWVMSFEEPFHSKIAAFAALAASEMPSCLNRASASAIVGGKVLVPYGDILGIGRCIGAESWTPG
jgi:hypothetical protein